MKTQRTSVRLPEDITERARVVGAPTGRYVVRALTVYVAHLQRQEVLLPALLFRDRTPTTRRYTQIRIPRHLVEYIYMQRYVMSTTIQAACDYYQRYYQSHKIVEDDVLSRPPTLDDRNLLDIDYLKQTARAV